MIYGGWAGVQVFRPGCMKLTLGALYQYLLAHYYGQIRLYCWNLSKFVCTIIQHKLHRHQSRKDARGTLTFINDSDLTSACPHVDNMKCIHPVRMSVTSDK